MSSPALLTVAACLLAALGLLLMLVAPGGHVNTRDYSSLPRRQLNLFNGFLLLLVLASWVTAALSIVGVTGAFIAALVIAVLCLAVLALDLGRVYPAVHDSLPPHLVLLEAADLVLGGVLVVIAVTGILT